MVDVSGDKEHAGKTKEEYAALLEEKARRKARTGLLPFTKYTFGSGYHVNWHHKLICKELDKFVSGETDRLILNCPSRHGKTELCSRRLPAYILGKDPDAKIIACSYGQDLAEDISVDVKNILSTPEYKKVFPETRLPDSNPRNQHDRAKGEYRRNKKDIWEIAEHSGRYLAKGVGGGIAGKGGKYLLLDDPIKDHEEARSKKERDIVWNWFCKVFRERANKDARILIIQTRWHQDDPVGRLKREMNQVKHAKQWKILNFPGLYRDNVPNLHPEDPREIDEALWPWFKSRHEWRAFEESDPSGFSALGQGMPTPPGGEILNKQWIEKHRWSSYPDPPHEWFWAIDPKGGSKDDRSAQCVIQLWLKSRDEPANVYLVAQRKGIWSQSETEEKMEELAEIQPWSLADTILIENKGDGPGIKNHLGGQIAGIVVLEPWADKTQRLRDVESFWRAGNVKIPAHDAPVPGDTSWTDSFVTQHTSFPGSQRDDQVDASTYAIDFILGSRGDSEPGEAQHYIKKHYSG